MKTIILILLASSFNLVYSQTAEQVSISLEPDWEKGTSVSYEIMQDNKFSTDGIQRSNTFASKNIFIEVTNNEKQIIELRWKYGIINFIDSLGKVDPLTLLMNTVQENLVVLYQLNKSNGSIEILNFDQIKDGISKRIKGTIDSLKNDMDFTEEHFQEIAFKLDLMFSSEDQINIIVLNDFFEFHRLYGKQYSTNQPQKIKEDNFGQPESDHYAMVISNTNYNQKHFVIEGVLESPFSEKMGWDRHISKQYTFSLSNYWLLYHKTEMTFRTDKGTRSIYEIRRIN